MHIDLTIHLHLHDETAGPRVTDLLAKILTRLQALERQESAMAGTITSVKQLVTDMKAATDALGVRVEAKQAAQDAAIQALKDQIAAGAPVTQEDLDGLAVDMTAEVAALNAIGADPANPLPDVPPATTEG